jgi:hypothetical protein
VPLNRARFCSAEAASGASLGRVPQHRNRSAFEKHRDDYVVPGGKIGEQLVEQIAMVRAVPKMMVGVDVRQPGIEDRLAWLLG